MSNYILPRAHVRAVAVSLVANRVRKQHIIGIDPSTDLITAAVTNPSCKLDILYLTETQQGAENLFAYFRELLNKRHLLDETSNSDKRMLQLAGGARMTFVFPYNTANGYSPDIVVTN